jgi:hypothetical protein
MIGTTWVECRTTRRASICTRQVTTNTECTVAIAAVHGVRSKFGFRPHYGRVPSRLFVAVNAAVESVAALEAQRDDVALAVVVCALGAGVHGGASQRNGR